MNRGLITRLGIWCLVVGCALAAPTSARATTVHVVMRGEVEYNQFTSGTFAGVMPGDPISVRIKLDSTNFLNNPMWPTRGYWFGPSTFFMTVGSVNVSLSPTVTNAYFVLRNNDPQVDGFFTSTGTGFDDEIPLDMTPADYGIEWKWTLVGGTTLSSLDILDALGAYGYPNISSFDWAVRFGDFSYPLYFNPPTEEPSYAICLPGDTNGDHVTDVNDISSFVDNLLNGTTDLYASCAADMNLDGVFDGLDLQSFTECVASPGCP
jgi:hypothetical protein